MRQTKRLNRSDPYRSAPGTAGWLARLFIVFVAVTGIVVAGLTLYGRVRLLRQMQAIELAEGAASLGAVERLYLQNYLSARAARLNQPAGRGSGPITFVISPGQGASTIAENLAAAGVLQDSELFVNYVRYFGLDSQLDAGTYQLDPQATIPQLAAMLAQSLGQEIELRFLEGWRLEEMANYLATTTPANILAEEFLAIARRQTAFDLNRYDFLGSLPAGATLEGYLFPDSYHIPTDADAAYLVDAMLQNFGQRVTPAMRQQGGARGLNLHQAVTLASIVEREAVLAAERPVIASVFLNRLAQGMRLDADPTVQYALGFQAATGSWWKAPLARADLAIDSPYNTYHVASLPPGPIANPGLASLEAVASPAQTNYLFFVADCATATPGAHAFSVTLEEHVAHVERCR